MTGPAAFRRDERGAAAAEMALMIPLLLILMFVGFEAGHYFYTEHKIIKAVREGARYGGRLSFSNYPCGGTLNATAATQIRQVTRTGTVTGTTPRIPNWDSNLIEVSFTCDAGFNEGIYRDSVGGAPIVTVNATAGYPSLFEALGLIDSSAIVAARSQAVVSGI